MFQNQRKAAQIMLQFVWKRELSCKIMRAVFVGSWKFFDWSAELVGQLFVKLQHAAKQMKHRKNELTVSAPAVMASTTIVVGPSTSAPNEVMVVTVAVPLPVTEGGVMALTDSSTAVPAATVAPTVTLRVQVLESQDDPATSKFAGLAKATEGVASIFQPS